MLWIGRDSPGYTVASSAQQHSLVLLDVGRQHQGTYTCIATNAAGQALCSASLHVSGCESMGVTDPAIPTLPGTGETPNTAPGPAARLCPAGSAQQAEALLRPPATLSMSIWGLPRARTCWLGPNQHPLRAVGCHPRGSLCFPDSAQGGRRRGGARWSEGGPHVHLPAGVSGEHAGSSAALHRHPIRTAASRSRSAPCKRRLR